jgi:hypothetical protein
MSHNAVILNPFNFVKFDIICHYCGNEVNPFEPFMGHSDCTDNDGFLRVDISSKNVEFK